MRSVSLLAAAALAAPWLALSDDPARRDFDADPSRPSALANGAFAVETAAPAERGAAHAELLLDYTHGLLSLKSGDTRLGYLLSDRLALHALGSFSLGPVELGADLPFALVQGSNLSLLTSGGAGGDLAAPIASTALGDIRLIGKAPLLRGTPLDVAAALELRLPTGNGKAFFSDGLAAQPQLLAGRTLGLVRLDASLGYLFRKSGQFLQLVAQDGFTYGLAASIPLPRLGRIASWRAIADLAGQLPRGLDLGSARHRAPLSVRAGVRARVWRSLAVDFGAGTGLAWFGDAGYGRESFRLFAGLRWERVVPAAAHGHEVAPVPEADRDRDGVLDGQDRCPDQPGPAKLEGCPDRDGDEVPDIDDKCPDQPGPAKRDGCPPSPEEPVVEIETSRLSLKDAITFETGRDSIKSESAHIIGEIAQVLNAHPELKRIRVEGHTDNVGGRVYNRDLSQRRARAVVRALEQRGVAAGRLEAKGYGFERPVAPNATALGRAKNRRVEFTILDQNDAPTNGKAPQE
jgi:outer membrane protein OmpA-like peptidoglycan-associated protein